LAHRRPFVAVTALGDMRRLPLVCAVAVVVLLTFSAIGHKEYRFVKPALPLLLPCVASGWQ
jgi:hypothetical protein